MVLREVQDTYRRTSVIDSITGDVWTYQKGAGVPAELPVDRHGSMTQAQFDAVPTAPAALRAFLISQYDQQQKQAEAALARQVAKNEKLVHRHKPGILATIRPIKLSSDGKAFEQAYLMLWNPCPGLACARRCSKSSPRSPACRSISTRMTAWAARPWRSVGSTRRTR